LSPRLLAEVERADDGRIPIAEVCRVVGLAAERLGVPRPSYERVRLLVHQARGRRATPRATQIAVDVAMRVRPPGALLDQLSGVGQPPVRRTK